MIFYEVEKLKAKSPGEGVEIRAIHGEKMTMAFFTMESGAEIPQHSHPHEQIGTVIKGAIEIKIGDEKKVVNAGGAYHVKSDVVHSGKCVQSPAEVLEVFSPPREDFK